MGKTTKNHTASATAVALKSPFPKDELKKWRQVLVAKLGDIKGDISDLVRDAMDFEDGHTTPTHQADRGSDVDMQDISLDMVGNEEELLWQIQRAIQKIDTGKPLAFGLCEWNKEPIPKTRLALMPWTPLSIEGANYMEDHHLSLQDMIAET